MTRQVPLVLQDVGVRLRVSGVDVRVEEKDAISCLFRAKAFYNIAAVPLTPHLLQPKLRNLIERWDRESQGP